MGIYVLCNTNYEDREFICAFSDIEQSRNYIKTKGGNFDNVTVFKHVLDSNELGELVHEQKSCQVRNWRCS